MTVITEKPDAIREAEECAADALARADRNWIDGHLVITDAHREQARTALFGIGYADLRGELDAYRDGLGQLTVDKPGPDSPTELITTDDCGTQLRVYQQTHQGIPMWICGSCVQLGIGTVQPEVCPGCGQPDMGGAALTRTYAECKTRNGYDGVCPAVGTEDCECPEGPR